MAPDMDKPHRGSPVRIIHEKWSGGSRSTGILNVKDPQVFRPGRTPTSVLIQQPKNVIVPRLRIIIIINVFLTHEWPQKSYQQTTVRIINESGLVFG